MFLSDVKGVHIEMVSVLCLSFILCFHKMEKNKVCFFSSKNDSASSSKICPSSKTSSRFKETTVKVEHSDSCWISIVLQTLYSEGTWFSKNQPKTRVELRTLIYRPGCFYFLCLNLKSLQNKVRSFSLIFLLFQLFFIQSGNSSFQTFTSKSFFQVCYNFLKTGTLIF